MNITMQDIERLTLDQIREFVEGSRTIGFAAPKREAIYEFIERVLRSQQYRRISRGQKGIVRRFLAKMSGLSRAQLTRWIGRWMKTRRVKRKPACQPSFPRRYTTADIALLAGVDAAHEDLSGPAIRRVMQREHEVFGKVEYVRLAGISVSHIYNLRNSTVYRSQRVRVQHTQARQVGIAERRKPDPRGRPGLSPGGHRAPGQPRRPGRAVPHQRRRHGHAMAGGGLRRDHLGETPDSGADRDATSVSLSRTWLSLR